MGIEAQFLDEVLCDPQIKVLDVLIDYALQAFKISKVLEGPFKTFPVFKRQYTGGVGGWVYLYPVLSSGTVG